MVYVTAGIASGFLMSSLFICTVSITMFMSLKDTEFASSTSSSSLNPSKIMIMITLISFPLWGIIGVILGILYAITDNQIPLDWWAKPNTIFAAAVIIITALMITPFIILVEKFRAGIIITSVWFMASYGWLLPKLAG